MKPVHSLFLVLTLLVALTGCGGGSEPKAEIVSITCLDGLAMDVHIKIINPKGIQSYALWSTTGGGGSAEENFTAPYPTEIDKTVRFEHEGVDDVPDRAHQLGLQVVIHQQAEVIIVYGDEPNGRCSGH